MIIIIIVIISVIIIQACKLRSCCYLQADFCSGVWSSFLMGVGGGIVCVRGRSNAIIGTSRHIKLLLT